MDNKKQEKSITNSDFEKGKTQNDYKFLVNLFIRFMDNKEQEIDISSLEFDKGKIRNDYKFLVQKLKNIKEIITLLENKFL